MTYLSLILTGIVSGLLVFIPSLSSKRSIRPILSFSGSFLLSISFLHIIPDLFQHHAISELNLGLYIMLGFFLQLILDYFSGGIEHGHTHFKDDKIGHFAILVFISLCLHAFLEAMPLDHFESDIHDHSILIGLLVHKAPIAFILASLLAAYKLNRGLIVLGIFIFSFSAPMGMLFGREFIADEAMYSRMMAISSGIILHLSTTILLENNEEHKVQWKKLLPMAAGALLASLSLL